ncbi:hypothetical protein IAQ61_002837 [Plenodomus lingam]|uniref:uncharacterized protein n=1 Tax=Leptosphaeria maculans TaxID=5022 RepID=UPI00331C2FFC|nr:hypothetical protein IAQ61_002837 [Plenodomus lingam]
MAQTCIARFKRFLQRRAKFRARRASSPALTSLDHPEKYGMHGVDQQSLGSLVVDGYDGSRPLNRSSRLNSTEAYARMITSPASRPPLSSVDTSPPPHPLNHSYHQVLLPDTCPSQSNLASPIPPPRNLRTAPSPSITITTQPSTTSTSLLISPISPIPPPLLSRPLPPRKSRRTGQPRTPGKLPTSPPTLPRQRFHPTRPAPGPPGYGRGMQHGPFKEQEGDDDVPGIDNGSKTPTTIPHVTWSCMRRSPHKSPRRSHQNSNSTTSITANPPNKQAHPQKTRRSDKRKSGPCTAAKNPPFYISAPIPGSVVHVDGAFMHEGAFEQYLRRGT